MPRGVNSRRRSGAAPILSFFVVALLGVVAGTLLGGRFAPLKEKGNADAGALVSQTFRDVFGDGERKPVLEIDLGAPRGASPADAPRAEKKEEKAPAPVATSSSPKESDDGDLSAIASCVFSSGAAPDHSVLLSEIAWMGTASSASDEWVELRGDLKETVSLRGWRLMSDDGDIEVIFGDADRIAPGGWHLLERTDDGSVADVPADGLYRGALSNGGTWLRLFDEACGLIDEIDARNGWPGGDNSEKRTLERNPSDLSWGTSAEKGGTPKRERNVSGPVATTTVSSLPRFRVNVSRGGDGYGTIASDPGGVQCGFDCDEFYDARTSVTLTATPSADSTFEGWSGACGGKERCAFFLERDASVIALFATIFRSAAAPPSPSATTLLINEVMAGTDGNSGDEFVELYNPTANTVDLTGWSIKKRNSAGNEESLLVASRLNGKVIGPSKYLLTVNESGYGGAVTPDVSWATSNMLAYTNNAVILYDPSGLKVDEASWTDIPKGQSYVRVSWEGSAFAVQAVPTPQNSAGN